MAGINANTKLMLHMDGANGSTTFTDDSPTPKTVTARGGAQISTSQSVFGGASAYLDGVDSYIEVSDHADFEFGSGNFSISFRVRFPNLAALTQSVYYTIFENGAIRLTLYRSGSNYLMQIGTSTDGSTYTSEANQKNVVTTNTWYEFRVIREGDAVGWFIGGTAIGGRILTASTTLSTTKSGFNFGAAQTPTNYLQMYLDEVKIDDVATNTIYSFTPPTTAHTADADDSLLLHFDGTHGSTTFTDSSTTDTKTVTPVGSAQILTSFGGITPKIGTGMLYLDGVNDWLSIPDSSDWGLSGVTDRLLFDGWVYTLKSSTCILVSQYESKGFWFVSQKEVSFTDLSILTNYPPITVNADSNPADYAWKHHVVQLRDGYIEYFISGVMLGRAYKTTVRDYAAELRIGIISTSFDFYGLMDEVRMSNVSRYTPTSYVVPTEPYSEDTLPLSGFGSIYCGTKAVSRVYLGSQDVTEVFLGSSTIK